MKLSTKIIIGLALILVILAGYIYYSRLERGTRIITDLSHPAVVKEIRQLGRLETAQFSLEKVIDTKLSQSNAINEFLFGDRILLIAYGKATAGVNLENIPDEAVDVSGTSLSIELPNTELFSVVLDPEKTQVYDRKLGILTKGDMSLETEARKSAEASLKIAACDAGILDEARHGAEERIRQLYGLAGFTNVTVAVKAGICP
jgi:hypothetical protein